MISNFYILNLGELRVKDSSLCYINLDQEKIFIPIKQITDLYLNIEVKTTTQLIRLVLSEGIVIHYFNNYEYYLGTLMPKSQRKSGKLILKEVALHENFNNRLSIVKK